MSEVKQIILILPIRSVALEAGASFISLDWLIVVDDWRVMPRYSKSCQIKGEKNGMESADC